MDDVHLNNVPLVIYNSIQYTKTKMFSLLLILLIYTMRTKTKYAFSNKYNLLFFFNLNLPYTAQIYRLFHSCIYIFFKIASNIYI